MILFFFTADVAELRAGEVGQRSNFSSIRFNPVADHMLAAGWRMDGPCASQISKDKNNDAEKGFSSSYCDRVPFHFQVPSTKLDEFRRACCQIQPER